VAGTCPHTKYKHLPIIYFDINESDGREDYDFKLLKQEQLLVTLETARPQSSSFLDDKSYPKDDKPS